MERTMMRTAAVNDVTLEYVERRASEPVVLIHAPPLADFFAPLMDQPALRAYRLVRYQRRGYAGSGRTDGRSCQHQRSGRRPRGAARPPRHRDGPCRGSLDRGRDRASARSGPPRPRGASSEAHAADAHQLRRVDDDPGSTPCGLVQPLRSNPSADELDDSGGCSARRSRFLVVSSICPAPVTRRRLPGSPAAHLGTSSTICTHSVRH